MRASPIEAPVPERAGVLARRPSAPYPESAAPAEHDMVPRVARLAVVWAPPAVAVRGLAQHGARVDLAEGPLASGAGTGVGRVATPVAVAEVRPATGRFLTPPQRCDDHRRQRAVGASGRPRAGAQAAREAGVPRGTTTAGLVLRPSPSASARRSPSTT